MRAIRSLTFAVCLSLSTLPVGAVDWNGNVPRLNTIGLLFQGLDLVHVNLPGPPNANQVLRNALRTTVTKPDAQGNVRDVAVLTTKLYSLSGTLVKAIPPIQSAFVRKSLGAPGLPGSAATYAFGIGDIGGGKKVLVRTIYQTGNQLVGTQLAPVTTLLVEVRNWPAVGQRRWLKKYRGVNATGIIVPETVVQDVDGNGLDEIVLVFERQTLLREPRDAKVRIIRLINGTAIREFTVTP